MAALEITHLFAQIGWREMESGTPFEHREGGATSIVSGARANQPSALQIHHLGVLRMGYIGADAAGARNNETLSQKAEKARRQSLG